MMSRLAECFAAQGHDVVVVGPREGESERYDAGLTYRVVRYADLGRPLEPFAIAAAYARALRSIRQRMPTIASVWWPVALPLAVIPRALRGPLAILVHGTEVSPGRSGLRRRLMLAVFARADTIVANSRFTASLLREAGVRGPVHVVALGVDVQPISPEPAAVPTILSVGRLVERKGFDRVIDALPRLRAEFSRLRYEIVGDGPERTALEQRARRLGVEEAVSFLGSVSEDELRRAYARAWCFALPVRNIRDDVEGFGIVYLEAAMASLPAIGGIASGAADAIVDNETGLLVDGASVDEIARALGVLLRDRKFAAELGRRGFERARGMTWARTTEQIVEAMQTPPSERSGGHQSREATGRPG